MLLLALGLAASSFGAPTKPSLTTIVRDNTRNHLFDQLTALGMPTDVALQAIEAVRVAAESGRVDSDAIATAVNAMSSRHAKVATPLANKAGAVLRLYAQNIIDGVPGEPFAPPITELDDQFQFTGPFERAEGKTGPGAGILVCETCATPGLVINPNPVCSYDHFHTSTSARACSTAFA